MKQRLSGHLGNAKEKEGVNFGSNLKYINKGTPHPSPETSKIQGLAYIDRVPYFHQ